ncbi:phage portal protein [Bilifractor sp. LCP19S3_H10]|uniref:phage portal protein n=1 Tax=Bilifractor sp. LCP19S3_H10 TaxID=3438736 RepID=UPI002A7E3F14|nr:phage portal protein [Bilifractor sp.]
MGIFDFFKKRRLRNLAAALNDSRLLEWLGIDPKNTPAIQEATYYTCIKLLSETMGKLPWKYYQDTASGRIRADPTEMTALLTTRPNPYMTPSTFWQTMEMLCQEYGNAFAWVQSDITKTGEVQKPYRWHWRGLWIMHPQDITIWYDNAGIFGKKNQIHYQYTNPQTGETFLFDSSEVLHFKTWYSRDGGLTGEPVKVILSDTIRSLSLSQQVITNNYEHGMTASMVMYYTDELDDDRINKLQEKFANRLITPQNAGKVVPVPRGLKLEKLNNSFVDSQFYELKKYSALQIAAAFGISPTFLNDYEKASYSNSESQNISFLVNTMLPRVKMYEEEINYKCLLPKEQEAGYFYTMNTNALLRTDAKTQEEIVTGYVNNGIYTPNEGRRMLQLPDKEGGDILMCNGNYIPITQVGKQYGKEGDNGED